jgi:HEAT repeat protein
MQNQNANSASPALDAATLTQAFEALKTYDWGSDRKALGPIDDALTATRGDTAARKDLETRLAAVLGSGVSRAAKDFACRALTVIGTSASVPALSALLGDAELSHMARYALERMPAPEAAAALRDALPKLNGKLKIGVIGSLGVRRDEASLPALSALIDCSDVAVANAAANALGDLGCEAAAVVLCRATKTASAAAKPAVADAALAAAKRLLADGNATAALATYNALLAADPPKYIRLAASRGTLWVAGKKS